VRAGLWPYGVGLGLVAAALVVGLAAAATAGIALALPRARAGWAPRLALALAVGLASAAPPLEFIRRAKAVPSIHDITTDVASPPQFVAILPLRTGAPNPPEYPGPHIGELQGIAYPQLQPLVLAVPPREAFARAAAAAEAMGWEVVAKDPGAGRIEAVATSRWFGFRDDVVIRVAPAGAGSRVDLRSKSRVGRSDLGANAARIRAFLSRLNSQP
jgi:uncharacterized protein (DUF1499 family)